MGSEDITSIERQIFDLTTRLNELRKASTGEVIPNYTFTTLDGEVSLLDMFGDKDKLLVIHNMGQGCRYCTLWADGFNGIVPHLESVMPVFLVSKDAPAAQRQFANSRGWRFRLASHAGGDYIREQSVMESSDNMPGAVIYTRTGNEIRRKNSSIFGPGDNFCPIWSLLALAGLSENDWTPQYNYWQRPKTLDDGGENLLD